MVAVEVVEVVERALVEQPLLDQLQQQLHATELHVNWQLEQLLHMQQQHLHSESRCSLRKSAASVS